MLSPALLLAALSLAIWLYLFAGRGQFWRLRPFDDDVAPHTAPQTWPSVVAIVPARNEAEYITHAIASLLQQDYPGEFRVILVDDHSDDDTAQLAARAAQRCNVADRLSILSASPLPAGWTGKLWALREGTTLALSEGGITVGALAAEDVPFSPTSRIQPLLSREERGTCFSNSPSDQPRSATAIATPAYLWFTDADITHAPDTLHRLVSRAERHRLDLTSLMVLLQAKTLPERAALPAFLFFFLKLYPPRWIADHQARTAGAAGGCILLRREALARIGSFAAIRSEVIDDCALARAVKRAGGRIWMGLTRASVSLRSYRSFAGPRDMIARTAFTQLHYSAAYLSGAIFGLLVTYLVPIAVLFARNHAARGVALSAWLLMSLLFRPTIRFYRLSPLWAPLLPLTAACYTYATLLSATRYYLRRGAQWKGRAQAPGQAATTRSPSPGE
jgi:glycosyltransferase involved in cell wall biosynthesis